VEFLTAEPDGSSTAVGIPAALQSSSAGGEVSWEEF
jgi:hypothetical protein